MSDFDFDLLLDRNKDIYDIIPNPNKFDDMDSDLMLINPVSEYCRPSQLNELLDQCNKRSLSFLHCNIRSLPKNLSLLNELLDKLNKPIDLIAITETKLNFKSVDNTLAREGHRTSGYSFVKLWRTKFMLLLRRNSDTIKAFCCGVNCGIAISKCTGYYTRKCVSAQTTRKHKFHGNSMELSWE